MNPWRSLATVVTVGATVLALAACGPPDDTVPAAVSFAPGTTMARLHDQGHVTIAVKFDQPLFGLRDSPTGQPQGFDVEIARMVVAALGLEQKDVTWVEAVSSQREQMIEDGTADLVIGTYSITPSREKQVSFAGPYYRSGQSVLVAADNPENIADADALRGRKVCTAAGSTSEDELTELGAEVVTRSTYSDCLPLVSSGAVVAMSTDDSILAGFAAQHPGRYKVVGKPFTTEYYGIGIRKGDTTFQDWLDDLLRRIEEDGNWRAAWDRTAGKVIPPSDPPGIGQR